MRVLLVGGTGFIGDAVARRLREAGHLVVTASRASSADAYFDARVRESLSAVLSERYDVVVNLAGAGLSLGAVDPGLMMLVNGQVPVWILEELAARQQATRLIHAASSTERLPGQEQDESDYSRTKHIGTQALREAADTTDVAVTILTVHNTYGPGQPRARFVAAVTQSLSEGRPVMLNYPDRVRDFVFIDDVAASFARAIEEPQPPSLDVHVGTGVGLTLRESGLTIADAVSADPALVQASPVDLADPNPATVSPDRNGTFGLCTTSFVEGIRRTIEEN